MVNLRRILSGSEESQRRAVDVLIHGIVESSISLNSADHKAFSENVARLTESAPPGCDDDALLVMSASAIQMLQEYNSRVSGMIKREAAELNNMIGMVAQAVTTISGGSGKAADSLSELRRGLESATRLDDFTKVKASLNDCLRAVCDEVQRRKAEAETMIADLRRQAERGAGSHFIPDEDHATGLSRRKTAEESIRQAVIIPGRKYLVTAVLDRLQSLNARFGQELGDRVLKALAEHIKGGLEDSDVLFRWSGPTIVALIWREDSIEQVRKSVRPVFETPFEKDFDIEGRSVTIPIGAAWSVIGLIPPAVNSFNYIDRFVAGQTPKDYC